MQRLARLWQRRTLVKAAGVGRWGVLSLSSTPLVNRRPGAFDLKTEGLSGRTASKLVSRGVIYLSLLWSSFLITLFLAMFLLPDEMRTRAVRGKEKKKVVLTATHGHACTPQRLLVDIRPTRAVVARGAASGQTLQYGTSTRTRTVQEVRYRTRTYDCTRD